MVLKQSRKLSYLNKEGDMPDEGQQIFAQFVLQAQIQAAKNQCKCITCQLLRKASDLIAAQLLQTQIAKPPAGASAGPELSPTEEEIIELKEKG